MCAKCKVVTTFSRYLVFNVLFYERKDCPLKGDSRGFNKLTFIVEMPRYFKEHVCGAYTQYTSFSSRKQSANAGSERKQFTENVSEAL